MRRSRILAGCCWLSCSLCWISVLNAQRKAPRFADPIQLRVGDEKIDTELEGGARPFLFDFNADGVEDLLVGEKFGGRLRIYSGIQSTTFRFGQFSLFDDYSPDARIPANNGFTPVVFDLDQDGRDDIVTPSWHGNVSWFRQIGSRKYAGRELVRNTAGDEIDLEWTYSVAPLDWDEDGKVDLLVTTAPNAKQEKLFVIKNAGTRGEDGAPRFQNAEPIQLGPDFPTEQMNQLFVSTIDWNDDGTLDVAVSNGSKSVHLFINQGRARFGEALELSLLPDAHAVSNIMHFSIADVDSNGKPDFLIGSDGPRFMRDVSDLNQDQQEQLATAEAAHSASMASWGRLFRSFAALRQTGETSKALDAVRKQLMTANQRQLRLFENIKALKLENQTHSYVWVILGL